MVRQIDIHTEREQLWTREQLSFVKYRHTERRENNYVSPNIHTERRETKLWRDERTIMDRQINIRRYERTIMVRQI